MPLGLDGVRGRLASRGAGRGYWVLATCGSRYEHWDVGCGEFRSLRRAS
ncbi:MAG: hypothetical protein LBM98_00290 [Oscillospiraceae bacterium]|nr:hypothetical protein [Oscillospiraceae bacterium]